MYVLVLAYKGTSACLSCFWFLQLQTFHLSLLRQQLNLHWPSSHFGERESHESERKYLTHVERFYFSQGHLHRRKVSDKSSRKTIDKNMWSLTHNSRLAFATVIHINPSSLFFFVFCLSFSFFPFFVSLQFTFVAFCLQEHNKGILKIHPQQDTRLLWQKINTS